MPTKTRTRASRPKQLTLRRERAVGASLPKVEPPDKVPGRALYLDDLRVPGLIHGRTVRSPIAHGRTKSITLVPAFDWSGVTVMNHRDIPGENVLALIDGSIP